jgi:hypothetical protein
VVRLPWTLQFDDERRTFALRFACEDCAHFDAATGHCRHEWPNQAHRREPAPVGVPAGVIDFCKEFELC